jgi:hypothetical protein
LTSAYARVGIAARCAAQRFASAAEMKSALEGCMADGTQPTADGTSAGKGKAGNSTLEFLLRRMRHRTDFPALSGAISAVNKALTSESENISSLANTILQDFALTNKILRLVNSVGFGGGGGHISTISRAVQILGFDQVRNIAVSLMLFEHLQNKAQASALRDEFVKTLFSGVLARAVASVDLLSHLNVVGRTAELARLFGIDFDSVVFRGSQYRVESMMLRLTKPQNYVLISVGKEMARLALVQRD